MPSKPYALVALENVIYGASSPGLFDLRTIGDLVLKISVPPNVTISKGSVSVSASSSKLKGELQ